jgi:hypothetical protein
VSETATVLITVNPVNNPPVANDDGPNAIFPNTPATGELFGNDSDVNGDQISVISFTVSGDPTVYLPGDTAIIAGVGTLTIGVDGNYTFTPAPNYSGPVPDAVYTISDGKGGTDDGTLRLLNIQPGVTARDDTAVTDEDTAVIIPVLNNDSYQGTPFFSAIGNPAHGTVTANANGTLTYTPAPGYSGPDSFTYTVTVNRGSSTGTVNVIVNPVNPPLPNDVFSPDNLWNANGFGFINEMVLPPLHVINYDIDKVLPIVQTVHFANSLNPLAGIGANSKTPILDEVDRIEHMLPMNPSISRINNINSLGNLGSMSLHPILDEVDRIEYAYTSAKQAQELADGSGALWDFGSLRHSLTLHPRENTTGSDFVTVHTTLTGSVLYVEIEHTLAQKPAYDVKHYSARLADGRPLPAWLSFDPKSGVLTGLPPAGTESLRLRLSVELEDGRHYSIYVEIEPGSARIMEINKAYEDVKAGADKFSAQVVQMAGRFDGELSRLQKALLG